MSISTCMSWFGVVCYYECHLLECDYAYLSIYSAVFFALEGDKVDGIIFYVGFDNNNK